MGKPIILKILKQQQHDINLRRTRKKKSESQMGFEPTTLRDLVGCSNHLSYWRLYGEQGPIVGLDWNRITRLHSQVMIGTQEVKNSLTASRCHLKAYPRKDCISNQTSCFTFAMQIVTFPLNSDFISLMLSSSHDSL